MIKFFPFYSQYHEEKQQKYKFPSHTPVSLHVSKQTQTSYGKNSSILIFLFHFSFQPLKLNHIFLTY